jgi:four helix bundle protein
MKVENGNNSRSPALEHKISDFKELEVWKVARTLRAELYQATRLFPEEEKFGLSAQIRRAAISATANLAEGYGRYSYQENIQFSRQSRGSLYELRDHLTTALDAGYIPEERYRELDATAVSAIRLVNGYIRATRNLKMSASIDKRPSTAR